MWKKCKVWKDIEGYDGVYQISNDGDVRNNRGMILKPSIVGDGYLQVHLSKNNKKKDLLIHLLVADHFLTEKRNGRELIIDHIDNIKTNNSDTNLQIVTQRINNSKDSKHTSQYVGVSWNASYNNGKGKWRAEIRINKKSKFLGYFDNEIDAHNAYQNELTKFNK